jgi:hypothetical protein
MTCRRRSLPGRNKLLKNEDDRNGMNGMKMVGRGRLEWSEEYRLAHNLLKIDDEINHEIDLDPGTCLGQASLLNSGD